MTDAPPFRICTQCAVPHYENCPDCFGFGQRPTGTPITAGVAVRAARDGIGTEARACPTCQSTPAGIPRGARYTEGAP